ncbi:MAG: hypothetical protein WBP65_06155 [Candidatus Sulfotelmatobacter sp.]|jgi:hypothetical protein
MSDKISRDTTKLLTPEQLAGVNEKLKRAEESIQNLDSEIVAFLSKRPKGGFSDDKQKAAKELVEFHTKRGIPLRFGVIAGEIAHHLRSSLEHIAWLLSTDQYRLDHQRWIGFPIAAVKPTTKDELTTYGRQVKGILSEDARALIERLQPYNAANPADDPLAILHELDREDKHQTLALIVCDWNMTVSIPLSALSTFVISPFYGQEEWRDSRLAAKPKFELAPYVAFAQLGRWKGEAVIPALTHLLNTVKDDIKMFAELPI